MNDDTRPVSESKSVTGSSVCVTKVGEKIILHGVKSPPSEKCVPARRDRGCQIGWRIGSSNQPGGVARFLKIQGFLPTFETHTPGSIDQATSQFACDFDAPKKDGWMERFLAFVRRHRPTGRPVDDSRDSIYD